MWAQAKKIVCASVLGLEPAIHSVQDHHSATLLRELTVILKPNLSFVGPILKSLFMLRSVKVLDFLPTQGKFFSYLHFKLSFMAFKHIIRTENGHQNCAEFRF